MTATDFQKYFEVKIVTLDCHGNCLHRISGGIERNELPLAQSIARDLFRAIPPFLPAAGLAAPQIGINKKVFIYSYDRNPLNFEVVINPVMEPVGDKKIESWEGCLSVLHSKGVKQLAKIARYETIKVTYVNWEGKEVQKLLTGFAAKVFQHELDHLNGIVNILKEGAIVKSFATDSELKAFMAQAKKEDAVSYQKPEDISVKEWATVLKADCSFRARL